MGAIEYTLVTVIGLLMVGFVYAYIRAVIWLLKKIFS